jgi:hypothetical protein
VLSLVFPTLTRSVEYRSSRSNYALWQSVKPPVTIVKIARAFWVGCVCVVLGWLEWKCTEARMKPGRDFGGDFLWGDVLRPADFFFVLSISVYLPVPGRSHSAGLVGVAIDMFNVCCKHPLDAHDGAAWNDY